ncbi:MAG: TolC family protein [Myxococcales bacterium]|nr:TolC family protein [Myxococcales bacterium]
MLRTCAFVAILLTALLAREPSGLAEDATPETLQLSEVLAVVVQSSPTLATAQINQSIANAQVLQTAGIDDILLQANGTYAYQSDESVDGNVTGSDKSSRVAADVTMSKLLSTGGTLSLHANTTRQAATLSFNDTELTEYKTQLSAQFSQPLLRGRGNAVTHATQRQAKHNLGAVALELQASARNEVQRVIEAYWEVVWAHKDLAIRKSSLGLAIERRRLTDSSVKLGSAPRTALLEVDQIMATNEEDILLAEQRVTERSLELRRLAGLEIGPGHLDFTTEEQLNVTPSTFDVNTVLTAALAASPELAALSKRGKSARIAILVARNTNKDKLDVSLSAGPLGTDDQLGGSLAGVATLKGYFVGAGINYERSIGNNAANGRTIEARERRLQLRVNERELRAEIAVSVSRAVQSANIAKKRMALSQRAIELSEMNIEAERRRFESGKATNFDVLQRQEEQKQARLRYARAEVDYLRATIAIQALRGELLSGYGISL